MDVFMDARSDGQSRQEAKICGIVILYVYCLGVKSVES